MEILKQLKSFKKSYAIVRKGTKTFKILRWSKDEGFYTRWGVSVQLVRDFWFNKTLYYVDCGNADGSRFDSITHYQDLLKGFDTNDQFK